MVRHRPVSTTASVVLTAHSPAYSAPIVLTTTFSDQAVLTLTSVNTRWGPVLTRTVNESTSAIFSSPV